MGSLLKDKVAIVTGSGRGIGRAHAITMAAEGASVVVNDLGTTIEGEGSDKSPADEVVAEIIKNGGKAAANYDSVATPQGAAGIIKTAIDNFGRLDILVNNAGNFIFKMIWEMTDEDWDSVVKVHLYGTFYCAREAVKIFLEQKSGRIINTASAGGLGAVSLSSYGAAKEGVIGLTRCMARELGKFGITVNAIRPGAGTRGPADPSYYNVFVKWAEGNEEIAKIMVDTLAQQMPPEGCTPVVLYLASDAADNINGCVFDVAMGKVGIYRDPPEIEQTLWKMGNWTPEELALIMPMTLTAGKVRELPPSTFESTFDVLSK